MGLLSDHLSVCRAPRCGSAGEYGDVVTGSRDRGSGRHCHGAGFHQRPPGSSVPASRHHVPVFPGAAAAWCPANGEVIRKETHAVQMEVAAGIQAVSAPLPPNIFWSKPAGRAFSGMTRPALFLLPVLLLLTIPAARSAA